MILTLVAFGALCAACSHEGKEDEETREAEESSEEAFHADNDIAMTVRSIVDAISVGEPLDTADYNFEGVLTDGSGRPLYTDVQGLPGKWDIDVLSKSQVVIRNLGIGDLLPEDLIHYIAGSLELTDADILRDTHSVLDDDEEAERVVYDFGGGYLSIDTRSSMAMNGLEGPLMTITATRKKPAL